MTFHCYNCKLRFEAEKFNLAAVTINCPVCCVPNDMAQSLTRSYGKTVGEEVTRIMQAVTQVAERGKESMAVMLDAAYNKIAAICVEEKEHVYLYR